MMDLPSISCIELRLSLGVNFRVAEIWSEGKYVRLCEKGEAMALFTTWCEKQIGGKRKRKRKQKLVCPHCGCKVAGGQAMRLVKRSTSVMARAFVAGVETELPTCSKQCRVNAEELFERTKVWLQHELREVGNAKKVIGVMAQRLSKMRDRAACLSLPKESEQGASSLA